MGKLVIWLLLLFRRDFISLNWGKGSGDEKGRKDSEAFCSRGSKMMYLRLYTLKLDFLNLPLMCFVEM